MSTARGCEHDDSRKRIDIRGKPYCAACRAIFAGMRAAGRRGRRDGTVATATTVKALDCRVEQRPPQEGRVIEGIAVHYHIGHRRAGSPLLAEPDPNPPPRLSPFFGMGLELPMRVAPPPPKPPAPVEVPMRPCRAGTHQIPWTAPRCRLCAADYHRAYMQKRRAGAAQREEVAS